MKISGIDFPKPLLDALRDGNLVVFAGAGVSMGEPAGLPDFRSLAMTVAEGTGEVLAKGEPEDGFLGRLQDKGVDVHKIAAQELLKDDPQPTSLHQDLLSLYSKPESVRLVTTNFDMLFERGAETALESEPVIFRAPALPLGTKFNGIVHVHGSVDREAEMVLTDKDFGRAYLTERWAGRFVVDLFRTYTVLFVGYSHSDVVMKYIARALPPTETEPRFALTDDATDGRWQTFNIRPIAYAKYPGDNHQALYDGISGLAKHVRRGVLDWRREIVAIAGSSPSIDEEAMDIIGESLSDTVRTKFFTDAASDPEWIDWLDRNNYLEKLFRTGEPGDLSGQERCLAWWLAERFARNDADRLLVLMSRHGTRLHPDLWTALGATVGTNTDPPLSAETMARWVSLLLATAPSIQGNRILPELADRCIELGLTDCVVEIFDAMAAPRLELKPGIDVPGFVTELKFIPETALAYQYHELDRLWRKGLKPNLSLVAESLLSAMVQNLSGQHHTLRSWQWAARDWDPISFGRHGIEPHPQDRHPESINVLIDAARDCLDYLVTERTVVAAGWCNSLIEAEAPILRRLAVRALSIRQDLTADEKSEWMLSSIGLYDFEAHHETLRAMKAIYPDVSPDQRQAIVKEILAFTWINAEGENEERHTAYRHFAWLNWLQTCDPDCMLVREALEDVLQRHPDFQPSEYPDLTHWTTSGGLVASPSPWNVDNLLAEPAGQWVERLLSTDDAMSIKVDRYDLLSKVGEAATQDFEWGLELADALAESGNWDTDIWSPLIRAWACELDEDRHRQVLIRLARPEIHSNHPRAVADVLQSLVKDGGLTYATSLLGEANRIATALWVSLDRNDPLEEEANWFNRALDHPAAIITQFWLESLSLSIRQQGTRPESLGDEYYPMLSTVIQDTSLPGRLGKSVLASQLSFISDVDEAWAAKNLIPLFENSAGPDCQAVWHGLLYGIIRPHIAKMLEDAFIETLPSMDRLFPGGGGQRRQFIRAYTDMVTYFIEAPLTSWIPKFFEKATSEDRYYFAWHVGRNLAEMSDSQRLEWWNRWLKEYWLNRCQGVPAKLDASEVEAMLEWLPDFGRIYSDAVGCATRMPNTPLEHGTIISAINDGELWSAYPEATADLLLYLAKSGSSNWIWHGGTKLMNKLLDGELDKDLKSELKEIKASLSL